MAVRAACVPRFGSESVNKCDCTGGILGHRVCHEARAHQVPCHLETAHLPSGLPKPRALCLTIVGKSQGPAFPALAQWAPPPTPRRALSAGRACVLPDTAAKPADPQLSHGHKAFPRPLIQEAIKLHPTSHHLAGGLPTWVGSPGASQMTGAWMSVPDDSCRDTPPMPPSQFASSPVLQSGLHGFKGKGDKVGIGEFALIGRLLCASPSWALAAFSSGQCHNNMQ